MKRLILIVALLTLAAFASGVMAQPKPSPAPAPAPAAPAPEKAKAPGKPKAAEKPMKFAGVVEKVDEMAKAIVVKGKVKGKQESLTFATDDSTKITKGKETISLAEVKSGMNVAIEYKKEGDKNMAAAVKVAVPKAAAPKKEKPAEAPKEAPAKK